MTPLAVGLDRLQGEKNSSLGYVMPTLYAIKRKVTMSITTSLVGERMKDALKSAIDHRFGSILKFNESNRDLIVAAVSHPLFKLNWIQNENDRSIAREIFQSEVLELAATATNTQTISVSNQNVQDDFFFYCLEENENRSRRNSTDSSTIEILNYLNDPRKELDILHKLPEIKRIFVKFNTTLSSSAPVERLFSQALLIFATRRNRLSSSNFERSLIVKHNKELLRI